MSKLIVDQIECHKSADATGDDLYFLVWPVGPDTTVLRVGPNAAWHDIETGEKRNTDVTLIHNFSGTYIVAVVDEDDSYDFDHDTRLELSKAMRFRFALLSQHEKDPGRLLGHLILAFANQIGRMRTNDDVLTVQPVTSAAVLQALGQGSFYKISLKVA